jgi:hypothetical protein
MSISESQRHASDGDAAKLPEGLLGVSLLEEFRSPDIWFQTFSAASPEAFDEYLVSLGVEPITVKESLFINSPEVGGGPRAGDLPREGQSVFMIERTIPGVGLAPKEKLVEVSKGSQAIIETIGDSVEWDHSYLTDEGTYCVYRATGTDKIQLHAEMAGIPADPVTRVEHIIRNFDFTKATL